MLYGDVYFVITVDFKEVTPLINDNIVLNEPFYFPFFCNRNLRLFGIEEKCMTLHPVT